jgi:hypothetical protein
VRYFAAASRERSGTTPKEPMTSTAAPGRPMTISCMNEH